MNPGALIGSLSLDQCDCNRHRIHLTEDDADLRALVADAFRRRAFGVTECVDGPDLVSKRGSDLLLGRPANLGLVDSDIRMPGATALEVLEATRDCEGIPPVILITAFPSDDTPAEARRLSVVAVIGKPLEIEIRLAKAEQLLTDWPGDRL